jgi:hypothetical protein
LIRWHLSRVRQRVTRHTTSRSPLAWCARWARDAPVLLHGASSRVAATSTLKGGLPRDHGEGGPICLSFWKVLYYWLFEYPKARCIKNSKTEKTHGKVLLISDFWLWRVFDLWKSWMPMIQKCLENQTNIGAVGKPGIYLHISNFFKTLHRRNIRRALTKAHHHFFLEHIVQTELSWKPIQTMTKKSYKFTKNHTYRWYDDTQF